MSGWIHGDIRIDTLFDIPPAELIASFDTLVTVKIKHQSLYCTAESLWFEARVIIEIETSLKPAWMLGSGNGLIHFQIFLMGIT